MSKCFHACGVHTMQIREYMIQTALVTFVNDVCHLFNTLVTEIGSRVVQMRSMMLTWQRRSPSSRLLPLATANRRTLVQRRRNRSSAAVSHHAFAPLTSCTCVVLTTSSQCCCWLRLCGSCISTVTGQAAAWSSNALL